MNQNMREAFDAIRDAQKPVTAEAVANWLDMETHRAMALLGALRAERLVKPGPHTGTWVLTEHGKKMATVMRVMLS